MVQSAYNESLEILARADQVGFVQKAFCKKLAKMAIVLRLTHLGVFGLYASFPLKSFRIASLFGSTWFPFFSRMAELTGIRPLSGHSLPKRSGRLFTDRGLATSLFREGSDKGLSGCIQSSAPPGTPPQDRYARWCWEPSPAPVLASASARRLDSLLFLFHTTGGTVCDLYFLEFGFVLTRFF